MQVKGNRLPSIKRPRCLLGRHTQGHTHCAGISSLADLSAVFDGASSGGRKRQSASEHAEINSRAIIQDGKVVGEQIRERHASEVCAADRDSASYPS